MNDDAVSPVIAFMLLLMIVVSCLSLLNAYYIPSLKQQAEIEHLRGVQQSFLEISTDIDRLLSFGQGGDVKEQIQLGGGDVIFSPLRSSGSLQIADDGWVASLIITNSSNTSFVYNCSKLSISYLPAGNFWVNQGFRWSNGVINITKGKRSTWADYSTGQKALMAQDSFIARLSTPTSEELISPYDPGRLIKTKIIFRNMISDPDLSFVSSNGFAGVNLNGKVNQEEIIDANSLRLVVNSTYLASDQVKDGYLSWITNNYMFNNCNVTSTGGSGEYSLIFSPFPVNISVIYYNLLVQAV